jgi:hypothetical protein
MSAIVDWMERVFYWLQIGVVLSIAIWILAILPMLCFRRTREFAAVVLMYSSYFNGFTCWWYSFIICYRACGLLWLIIGVLFMGVGVVPITLIGTAIGGAWPIFWNVIIALALTFGLRVLALTVAYRVEKRREAEAEAQAAAYAIGILEDPSKW